MNRNSPWNEIATPIVDYNVRRVAGVQGVPVYWGKDATGQCLLIVELQGDHSIQYRSDAISLYGIGVDLRNGENTQRLVLTLARHVDRDLFIGLCDTLIASLLNVADSQVALAVSLAHLKRWKAFLAGRKARVLSEEEVRGLFAELYVLRLLYRQTLPHRIAVNAWCGVDDAHQDFIFENTAIEVKSLSGRERNSVRISSEDQLEGLTDNLFLMTVRLSDMPDAEKALSLNGLVALIEQELNTSEALEQFSGKIAGIGYAPLADYDAPRFLVSATNSYRVTEEFPRLIRSQLPQGLVHVSYDVQLEAIEQFACEDDAIFGSH
ncbi:hypothetical protein J2W32_005035 [Variovorax boronicumulans]|uniref:PD-(D/E)XK motif protein n=1 Tax=Variovorax boronicumulans TaxID=436515 RepID=A0AAW8D3V2_9BURK|nr:PD-(D/E)XK motif protein [Variovorax boronicumulans]MDP9895935.1 hypothetical protein [Variovorax boronicumulans]MDQ0055975.1 hypothetical protein [Variovorax boronicumulans]